MLKYDSFRLSIKYSITLWTPQFLFKKYFFFIQYKNEWKEHEFWRQKIQKVTFTKTKKYSSYKNKKVIKIDNIYVNKILVFKEESYGTKNSFKGYWI